MAHARPWVLKNCLAAACHIIAHTMHRQGLQKEHTPPDSAELSSTAQFGLAPTTSLQLMHLTVHYFNYNTTAKPETPIATAQGLDITIQFQKEKYQASSACGDETPVMTGCPHLCLHETEQTTRTPQGTQVHHQDSTTRAVLPTCVTVPGIPLQCWSHPHTDDSGNLDTIVHTILFHACLSDLEVSLKMHA